MVARRKHPKLGHEYTVVSETLPDGFPDETEGIVPVGFDQYGNLRADHYGPGLDEMGDGLLWNEENFLDLLDDGTLSYR